MEEFDFNEFRRMARTPRVFLPPWLLSALGIYRSEAENSTISWTIQRDVAASTSTVYIRLSDERTLSLVLTDEFIVNCVPHGDWPPVVETVLETFYSPWPVLGWRGWQAQGQARDSLIGYYGRPWQSPRLKATCSKSEGAPHIKFGDDRCGIYLLKQPQALNADAFQFVGLCVATNVIEHERGYRAGDVRCIGITPLYSDCGPLPPNWQDVPVMSFKALGDLERSLLADPDSIPAP